MREHSQFRFRLMNQSKITEGAYSCLWRISARRIQIRTLLLTNVYKISARIYDLCTHCIWLSSNRLPLEFTKLFLALCAFDGSSHSNIWGFQLKWNAKSICDNARCYLRVFRWWVETNDRIHQFHILLYFHFKILTQSHAQTYNIYTYALIRLNASNIFHYLTPNLTSQAATTTTKKNQARFWSQNVVYFSAQPHFSSQLLFGLDFNLRFGSKTAHGCI